MKKGIRQALRCVRCTAGKVLVVRDGAPTWAICKECDGTGLRG